MSLPYDAAVGVAHLRANDPVLRTLIDRVGPPGLATREPHAVYDSLARAITAQQLSTKAARTILGRLHAAAGGQLTPDWVCAAAEADLRGAGLSHNKMLALRDLSARAVDGRLPDRSALERLDNDAIIEQLTDIRGIGRWTVEMLLLFDLGRPDILPTTDLGVRKGMAVLDGLDALPSPRAMIARALPWQPYRSLASWYLWRAAEGS